MTSGALTIDHFDGEREVANHERAFAWDGAYSFTLFSSMLFILQLGSLGALLFSAAAVGCAVARRHDLAQLARQRWFLLLFPAFAVLSTAWSEVPLDTLKHSLEFALTVVAALLLTASRNQRSMLLGIFAAFAIYVVISLLVGNVVDVGTSGAAALSGLNDSKNEQADTGATGFIISVAVFAMGIRSRSIIQCLAALAAAAVEMFATAAALSAGAVAGAAIAVAAFAAFILLSVSGRAARATVLTVSGIAALGMAGVFVLFTGDVLAWLSTAFRKDTTLTGRTYLWSRARDLVVEHPALGNGFAAFWQQGNLDAEGLWQFAGITDRQGFNFHSTIYDVLVALGWTGLVIFLFTLIAGFTSLAANYIRKPTLMTCLWLSMAVYIFVRLPVECIGINEFYFSTVLLFALLGYAHRRRFMTVPS
jgi:exopolysaccharide production protein ExoQ